MATTAGGSISVSSFSSPSSSAFSHRAAQALSIRTCKCVTFNPRVVCRMPPSRRSTACHAAQESPSATATAEATEKQDTETAAAPAKPKPKPKAAAKPLPQMMEEDVIPSLKTILQSQDDISDLELSFDNKKLEGSFLKKGNPYSFWAFFPDGLTGPKGFSLSSYGTGASTVEPFLVDEKKITEKHIVFWVEKRLAAQGIIPVWNE